VVRALVKAYYDKRKKKTDGTVTAENKETKRRELGSGAPAAAIQPVLKPAVSAREPQSEDPR
jgi:hypothetical protein